MYIKQNDNTTLKWVPARNAISHNVYFGESGKMEFKGNQRENVFNPGKLEPHATYYWRIDEVTDTDTLSGPLWQFTTK